MIAFIKLRFVELCLVLPEIANIFFLCVIEKYVLLQRVARDHDRCIS